MLDSTLVVWMGEFGRTAQINGAGGRDHWGACQSVVMACGGVRGGQVYGRSDRAGAYPAENPVTPGDLGATIYSLLGIPPMPNYATSRIAPIPSYGERPFRR